MHITFRGWIAVHRENFRRDLLALIGAGTPAEFSELAAKHAQHMARAFTAATLCTPPGTKARFTTEELSVFCNSHLKLLDRYWNRALSRRT